ncbi:hypothetical protein ABEB36_000541 [Hypothenemus hampei]|uniref:Uncharacterized protein n=1 Tax=Hypothenemus hampei TaxID=57062 RepID=A0ABD1FBM3_HYPHA
MISGKLYVFILIFGVSVAYGPGDYVPKSFYVIDQFGHQSDKVQFRNRREIMPNPSLSRVRRGGGAYAGSYSGSGQIPDGFFDAAGGANAFAGSTSSANSGFGPGGPSSGKSYGGLGSGQSAGYKGPILFSRFGETEGTGIHVSGQAQGPNAAFASSSSSIDGQGKIKYSVQSGKY